MRLPTLLRHQQLRVVHRLSHRVDALARGFSLLFAVVFLLEVVEHGLVTKLPQLEALDAFDLRSEKLLHEALLISDIVIPTLLGIYWLGLRVYLKHPNRRWGLILTNTTIKERLSSVPKQSGLALCQTEIVASSGSSFETLIGLNEQVYNKSRWSLKGQALRNRNQSYIDRYSDAFMLFLEPIGREQYIGYSCILPLSPEGADSYRNGSHGDLDFPAWFVAQDDQPPAAILIFAIALHENYSFKKSGADRELSRYFVDCLWYHCLKVATPWIERRCYPPLWVQTEETGLE